jgi:DNA-binding protein H-NS
MNFEELWVLHEELTKVLVDKIAAEKLELELRLTKLGRPDVSFADRTMTFESPAAPGRIKIAPKYRNTSPPYETWSGRGKLPRWLKKRLEDGGKIEDFKISEDN